MKNPILEKSAVRTITDQNVLISWLAEEVKRSEPQTEVRKGFIDVFDDLVEQFRESASIEFDLGDGTFFDGILAVAAHGDGSEISNESLREIVRDIYGESIKTQSSVGVEFFLTTLLRCANLSDCFDFEEHGDNIILSSNDRLKARTGKRFRVTLA